MNELKVRTYPLPLGVKGKQTKHLFTYPSLNLNFLGVGLNKPTKQTKPK